MYQTNLDGISTMKPEIGVPARDQLILVDALAIEWKKAVASLGSLKVGLTFSISSSSQVGQRLCQKPKFRFLVLIPVGYISASWCNSYNTDRSSLMIDGRSPNEKKNNPWQKQNGWHLWSCCSSMPIAASTSTTRNQFTSNFRHATKHVLKIDINWSILASFWSLSASRLEWSFHLFSIILAHSLQECGLAGGPFFRFHWGKPQHISLGDKNWVETPKKNKHGTWFLLNVATPPAGFSAS